MSASQHARRERRELADLMLALGPDAPTLCEGWTVRDLAAHLVVRESRPDASIGIVVSPLSGWTRHVQEGAASRPFPELVRSVRSGPPTLSLFSIPGVDGLANLVEYVVHHEDVRRAMPDWQPRDLPPDLADELWRRLRSMARLAYRRVPVGVTLVRTDGAGGTLVARRPPTGADTVTVTGTALDLLLRSYGRTAVNVAVTGSPGAVAAFESARLSI